MSIKGGCKECERGFKPTKNKMFCEAIPETYMNYRNPWAVGCITFAVLGILVTSAVTVIFWKYWDTPIIKASARELSAVLLLGEAVLVIKVKLKKVSKIIFILPILFNKHRHMGCPKMK